MIMFRQLSRCIAGVFRLWWTVDRIRISPSAGRLRALTVGDCVQIRDGIYTVVDRQVPADRSCRTVQYSLTDLRKQAAVLIVTSSINEGSATGELRAEGTAITVFDDDVVMMKQAMVSR